MWNRLIGPLSLLISAAISVGIWGGPYLDARTLRAPNRALAGEALFRPKPEGLENFVSAVRRSLAAKTTAPSSTAEASNAQPVAEGAAPSLPSEAAPPPPPEPAGDPPWPLSSERCWLSWYVPSRRLAEDGPVVIEAAKGALDAAAALWDGLPPALRNEGPIRRSRLKVDCLHGEPRPIPYDGGTSGLVFDRGLDGVLLRHASRGEYWHLPSFTVERPASRAKIHEDARVASRDARGWTKDESKAATPFAFRTHSWVEGSDGALLLSARGNVEPPPLDAASLRARIRLAADYLTRETGPSGRMTYTYTPTKDTTDSAYNMLRHAGTLYSMMQAQRLEPDDDLLDAGKRAAKYLVGRMKEDSRHPGEWFVLDGKRAKLGGAGLALIALVELEKASPGAVEPAHLQGLAQHIERMQNPDGSFTCFYEWDDRKESGERSVFYPGEAMLGLIRLEQLTGERKWVDIAARGADYLVDDQWVGWGIRVMVAPDAWLLQALEELDRVAPDEGRRAYAFAVGRAIAGNKLMNEGQVAEDMLGADMSGLRNWPNAATAGSYGEALAAAARLELRADGKAGPFAVWARRNAEFQLRNQFTGDNTWFLPNPERASGGFRLKTDDAEIRNDYVQHNLSGLFGLLPTLDPSAPDIGARHSKGAL